MPANARKTPGAVDETTTDPQPPDADPDEFADALTVDKAEPAPTRAQEAAQLRARLAQLEAENADAREPETPTHVLHLADGSTVDVVNGGAVTHVDVGTAEKSKTVRVLTCTPID